MGCQSPSPDLAKPKQLRKLIKKPLVRNPQYNRTPFKFPIQEPKVCSSGSYINLYSKPGTLNHSAILIPASLHARSTRAQKKGACCNSRLQAKGLVDIKLKKLNAWMLRQPENMANPTQRECSCRRNGSCRQIIKHLKKMVQRAKSPSP